MEEIDETDATEFREERRCQNRSLQVENRWYFDVRVITDY